MSPGKLLYKLFYQPLAYIKQVKKAGILNYFATQSASRDMVAHSLLLKEVAPTAGLPTLTIYFLTGEKYWYQTAFCLYSLQKVSSNFLIKGIFVDDGTFTGELKTQMLEQFPSASIVSRHETENLLNLHLPADKYPVIRKKRLIYPHLKKLTDVHFQPGGWKLVLDSDMLFFKYPEALINWLQAPKTSFFLRDPVTSYHYTIALMEQLTGKPVRQHLNVGLVGLKSAAIDWDAIELWITELEKAEGKSYLLEQALSAMIVAGQITNIAPPGDYLVLPTQLQVSEQAGVLHHYVAESKEWYYKTAWRKI
jgi:hypothetical protein